MMTVIFQQNRRGFNAPVAADRRRFYDRRVSGRSLLGLSFNPLRG
ncbi:hypothetical protein [Sphingobium yanoikuyae]|jgi:hypothetical protein|nr:hypothetical protein [Sphingobium yanoikuyae]